MIEGRRHGHGRWRVPEAILADEPEQRAQKERLAEVEEMGGRIVEALKTVYDPEIPVNIYELGLIYKIDVEDDDQVLVEMTLTLALPCGRDPAGRGRAQGGGGRGCDGCEVKIVWDPPWNPSMMTEEAQLELGMIY